MYEDFVLQMQAAKTAKERSSIIAEMCRLFGFCEVSAYRALRRNGWESDRKKRSDAGASSINEKGLEYCCCALAELSPQKRKKDNEC